MKVYSIKGRRDDASYCTILQETEAGYILRICIDKDGYEKVSEDFIEKDLFELCLKTGYINEVAQHAEVVA